MSCWIHDVPCRDVEDYVTEDLSVLSLWVSNQGWTAPREPWTAQNTCDWQPTRKYKIDILDSVFLWQYQNITGLTSSHGWSILSHLSPISQSTCLHFQRGSMESLRGFLIASVTSDDLLLSFSRNFPRTSILLPKCWKVMGLPWLLLNDIYCKVTIWSKGICVDWLWAIAGQSGNQVLDGSENSCSDAGQ